MLELFDHHAFGQHAEFLAAKLLRHVDAPQAHLARLLLQRRFQLGGNQRVISHAPLGLAPDDEGLMRDQFALRKVAHRVLNHPGGVGQREIHVYSLLHALRLDLFFVARDREEILDPCRRVRRDRQLGAGIRLESNPAIAVHGFGHQRFVRQWQGRGSTQCIDLAFDALAVPGVEAHQRPAGQDRVAWRAAS
ncbi:hypothetical protein D9M68_756560 [compost metagenome]